MRVRQTLFQFIKKDPLLTQTTRPISILPILSKIMERYVQTHFSHHLKTLTQWNTVCVLSKNSEMTDLWNIVCYYILSHHYLASKNDLNSDLSPFEQNPVELVHKSIFAKILLLYVTLGMWSNLQTPAIEVSEYDLKVNWRIHHLFTIWISMSHNYTDNVKYMTKINTYFYKETNDFYFYCHKQ